MEEDDFEYECPECPEVTFKGLRRLYLHKLKAHKYKDYKPYTLYGNILSCTCCFHETTSKAEMELHVEKHKIKCTHCDELFSDAFQCSMHVREAHDKDTMYKCCLCEDSTYGKRKILYVHCNTAHMKKYLFKCHGCNIGFWKSDDYKNHIVSNHGRTETMLLCIVCNSPHKNKNALRCHQLEYHRVFTTPRQEWKCQICRYKYRKEKTYLKHVCKKVDPIPCDICGRTFKNASYLKQHYRVHTGESPYKCSHCDKSFKSVSILGMHERVHTGEKPFKCQFCGKGFSQHTSKKIHERIHTGETPYKCQVCDKGFKSRTALNLHMRACTVLKQ